MLVYDINYIRNLVKTNNKIFDSDIINNLIEIKHKNRFIKKKSPSKPCSNYNIDKWNINKKQNKNYEEKLNINLNKLSSITFKIISNEIITILESENYDNNLIKIIFNKNLVDISNTNVYLELLNKNMTLKTKFLDKVVSFDIDIAINSELTKSFVDIDKYTNFHQLVAILYNKNILPLNDFLKIYKNLFNKIIDNNLIEDINIIYYRSIVHLLEKNINKLKQFPEFNEIKNEIELIKNQKNIQSKLKFIIMDITDLI